MTRDEISKMTRDDLLANLFGAIAGFVWHDVTDECSDPEAVQAFAAGLAIGRQTVYVLTRYEDEGEPLALIAIPKDEPPMKVPAAPYQLQWLWDQVQEQVSSQSSQPGQ